MADIPRGTHYDKARAAVIERAVAAPDTWVKLPRRKYQSRTYAAARNQAWRIDRGEVAQFAVVGEFRARVVDRSDVEIKYVSPTGTAASAKAA